MEELHVMRVIWDLTKEVEDKRRQLLAEIVADPEKIEDACEVDKVIDCNTKLDWLFKCKGEHWDNVKEIDLWLSRQISYSKSRFDRDALSYLKNALNERN